MKKRSILAIALCVIMLFSTVSVFAGEAIEEKAGAGMDPRTVTDGSINFVRSKALQGKLTIQADSSGSDLDYIKVTVTVQQKNSSGKWAQYQTPYDIYGDAENGFILSTTYVNVKESGVYRVKAVFSDKRGGVVTTTSAYYSPAASL